MMVLSTLEWDAIVIAGLLGFGVGLLWFSDKAFGSTYRGESGVQHAGGRVPLCGTVEVVSNLALATVVAIVLTAFGGTFSVGADWLWAVIVMIVAVNSTVGATNLWQGRSTRFVAIGNSYHAVQIIVMALAYVYVERVM
ncbi:MAG: DUF1761 family protein [Alphaproteobacteria bacterium GM202ARS2]|nr:DUF1761 family protein [Alphaproteobacteria bacterium GM202ARS2]